MKRIAVLCVGNDCPGLNAAIRAATVKASELNIEILGVKDGFEGFLSGKIEVMTRNTVSGILHKGGTILGTSLFLPVNEEDIVQVAEKVEQYSITCLLILGGRLGVRAALKLMQSGVPSVLVPATIDNDLSFSDFSIGFFTAVEHVKDALDILHATAESHHRVMIVETMGKPGGWIAVVGGLAGGADYIITSAEPLDIQELLKKIRSRYESQKRFSLVIVENDVNLPGEIYQLANMDSHIPPAEAIGEFLEKQLKDINMEWRYTNLGYLQRGGSPVSMDRLIAIQMATRAVEMVKAARVYHAVGMKGLTVTEVPYSDTMINVRTVEEHLKNLAKLFY
ncbi:MULTISPECIES: 6-phosphofructokinase [Pseudothermotoga]|uniref:6-phosphofructokinase n=1 Tax=Pseudothermotoga lettingae (strain ATCC BAA-301 / DSM 14385 / NBRC 107922 / TMO) TaxID=416591 RepID=A8F8L6_PSELT|nr:MULTISPECIES: 6-phosphofructokinase [Pseudothermotoga]ABV34500.1 6-phosphofructokinase [Pseudothermotoga lettingae TMO]KUK21220.1 MAG: 6-phosphofructokinase [Pseudothermotoga lettingae]MDI3494568.1 ATP-dependent phosphofructokinase / diphosphate-dependent phosphofructokinase [Pseudothermotoga sp.]MDK2883555.1 ATP-dependent phosphofructokinase / diphosphate-dependent phosphofructokinase [Pseudothermotoga sp.]GLI48554.1 ATP-dependent 6-phosphofructokinase [Pseudothermotoga lettingae TMO]